MMDALQSGVFTRENASIRSKLQIGRYPALSGILGLNLSLWFEIKTRIVES